VLFDQRYIGTMQEKNTLNILLEFVPRGSMQSLLGMLGSFRDAVGITYSRAQIYLLITKVALDSFITKACFDLRSKWAVIFF